MSEAFDPKELPEWKEAAALGVDLDLLQESLRRTPQERAEVMAGAARFILETRALQEQNGE
jgi:hypothetical protein